MTPGQFSKYPELVDGDRVRPRTVRILMVADGDLGFGGFGTSEFALSILIEILRENTGEPVQFEVTKAHRGVTGEPGVCLQGFKFSPASLEGFHQVWLFGHARCPDAPLEGIELRALAEYMDGGGGVFATGDHDDLGSSLCSQIPRVGSMRKWKSLPGQHFRSAFRKDTLRKGTDGEYRQPCDENDVEAQVLFPIIPSGNELHLGCPKHYTHDLITGLGGMVVVLPDHRHEGECLEPENLEGTWTVEGYTVVEYPVKGGHREAPRLIARGRALEPHLTYDYASCLPVTQVDSFGAIAAYDGQEVDKGRVVVDSSFHHFIDMNLRQFKRAAGIDPNGHAGIIFKAMKTYFRNIARWLAPEPFREDIRNRSLWAARWTYPLNEELMAVQNKDPFKELGPAGIIHIGVVTRETLRRSASESQVVRWASDILRVIGGSGLFPLADPWVQNKTSLLQGWLDPETVADAVLGGVAIKLALDFPGFQHDYRNSDGSILVSADRLRDSISNGAIRGGFLLGRYLKAFNYRLHSALQNTGINYEAESSED